MGNKRWTRVLALIMAAVCTLTVVAAAGIDRNGDGKYTVYDLQLLFAGNEESYADTLKQILGGKGDELNAVREEDGVKVYEIWTEMGLQNMAKNATKGYTFELKANIDLGGKDWTPVANFKGIFNGNNKTISNFKITKSISGDDGNSMGFFGSTSNANDTSKRTEIKDLNLREVTIIADGTDGDASAAPKETKVRFVGAVVGTNRGDVKNCTAVSAVIDKRAEINFTIGEKTYTSAYYGTIAGRNTTNNGTVTGTNEMVPVVNITKDSLDDADLKKPEALEDRVNSMMATFFPENNSKADYETQKAQRIVGIVGARGGSNATDGLYWQDLTNSTDLADPVLQQRREAVANEMYDMCTVEWKPAQTMYYYDFDEVDKSGNAYATPQTTVGADKKFRGLPYTHGSCGWDRFNAYVEDYINGSATNWTSYYFNNSTYNAELNKAYAQYKENPDATNAAGKKLVEIYPELVLMSKNVSGGHQLGWSMYIGADCSSQAAWAWRKISAVTGTGFADAQSTAELYMMDSNITQYGIQPVNGMKFDNPGNADGLVNEDGTVRENTSGDKCAYLSNYLANKNNETYWLETLALTSKGDILMEYSPRGGHTRVAISDAVVIRDYKGVVDAKKSYIYSAEQGGGGEDSDIVNHYSGEGWKSTCCVNRRETFYDMTLGSYSEKDSGSTYYNKEAEGANQNYKAYLCWFPITCDALRSADSAAGTVQISMTNGVVTSNFHIARYTVNGETTYTGIAQSGQRKPITSVDLSSLAAGTSVTVRLANGKDYTYTR